MGRLTYSTQEVQDRLDAVGTLVRPNLLDNWFFVGGGSQQGGGQFPINQLGQTSYTNSNSSRVYTIDRWKVQKGTVSLTSDALQVSFTTTSVQYIQTIENGEKLYGKKVTLSAIMDGTLGSIVIDIPQSPTTGTIGRGINFPSGIGLYLRLSSDGLYVSFFATSTYTINTIVSVAAAKLELGDTQTLAHQENGEWVLNEIPNYQQELAKCQRYAMTIASYERVRATLINSGTIDFVIPVPVTMRAVPTLPSTLTICTLDGTAQTGFTFSAKSGVSSGYVGIRATKASHGLTDALLYSTTVGLFSADL